MNVVSECNNHYFLNCHQYYFFFNSPGSLLGGLFIIVSPDSLADLTHSLAWDDDTVTFVDRFHVLNYVISGIK